MTIPLLFAFPADLQLEDLLIESETLTLLLTSSRLPQVCPSCAHGSSRVHSCYSRQLADLPCQGRAVQLSLKVLLRDN
jgi:transposase